MSLARQLLEVIATVNVKKHFANVFSGLGNLGEEYHIKLKEDAVPYSLFTPWNVAIPLREKVRKGLKRMEAWG